MKPAFFHPIHGTIGKTTHTQGFLFKHANYITRPEAQAEYMSRGSWDADRAHFLSEISKYQSAAYGSGRNRPTLRANARLADTFTLPLPRGTTPEHHREMLGLFADALSDNGRANMFVAIHHNVPDNPHAHVLFIDRDENGKPVAMLSAAPRDRAKAGFTEPNATEHVRILWETAQNTVFEDYNYDLRADRRSMERKLADFEMMPPEFDIPSDIVVPDHFVDATNMVSADHSGHTSEMVGEDLLPAPERTPTHVEPEIPEVESAADQEDDMPRIIEPEPEIEEDFPEYHFTAHERAERALELDWRLEHQANYVARRENVRSAIVAAERAHKENVAQANRDYRELRESENHRDASQRYYEQHGKGFAGRMKGFHLKAFGFEWKSQNRVAAEDLKADADRWSRDAMTRAWHYKEWDIALPESEKAVEAARAELVRLEAEMAHSLQLVGTDHEIEVSRANMETERQRHLNAINAHDVQDMYDQGVLSAEKAKILLERMGQHELAMGFEERSPEDGFDY